MGTKTDETFPDSWHSDAATVSSDAVANIRSKVYLSPKLWYVRVNVIEAKDLIPSDKTLYPEVYVKANLGNQILRTRVSQSKTLNPDWNEDLMFVAAEPFEEPLALSVEDRFGQNKDEILGSDLRPTAKQLWKSNIGVLEVGIISAPGLIPMKTKDGKGTNDAYCVAKYGEKWIRTRTIVDSFAPKWNEQYTWEVFDPSTVIIVWVFDNGHLHSGDKSGGS
ncbi:unnamed protein product [Lupinus luteus]|uniref:C2 domain-containing protein n=1 Tax=Lupinus luteus TaxID=3873 RepID=A0AAV1W4Z0_LUPLU